MRGTKWQRYSEYGGAIAIAGGQLEIDSRPMDGTKIGTSLPARSQADERVRFQDNTPNLREGYGGFQPVYNTPAGAHCR